MLHYNPQHVSSSTLLIFRRASCIITASGIVTLCKRQTVRIQPASYEIKLVHALMSHSFNMCLILASHLRLGLPSGLLP